LSRASGNERELCFGKFSHDINLHIDLSSLSLRILRKVTVGFPPARSDTQKSVKEQERLDWLS